MAVSGQSVCKGRWAFGFAKAVVRSVPPHVAIPVPCWCQLAVMGTELAAVLCCSAKLIEFYQGTWDCVSVSLIS